MSPELAREIGAFARAAREATGLDWEAFGKKVGLSASSLKLIEYGHISSIGLPTLEMMARAGGKRLLLKLELR